MFFVWLANVCFYNIIGIHYNSILLFAELQMQSNINTNKWRLKKLQTPFRQQLDNN